MTSPATQRAFPGDGRGGLRGSAGFTLIELIVSLAILGVVFSVFSMVLVTSMRDSGEVREDAVLQGEVRASIDLLAQDLRQAYSGDKTSPIKFMTPTLLTFLSPDRSTPLHNRLISYRLLSGKLERASVTSSNTDGPPWNNLTLGSYSLQVGSVRNATVFTYFDAAGLPTTTPSALASVTVTVIVSTATATTREFTYSTQIALRTTG